MPSTRTLLIALGATAALALSAQPVANAEPAPPLPLPLPISGLQAPGLPAMESLGPAIQQAAGDPTNAASMLMAAAAAFAGNSAAPPDSKNVAAAVNQFVADPQVAHVPAAGAIPGAEAHLPAGHRPGAMPSGPSPDAAPLAAVPAPTGGTGARTRGGAGTGTRLPRPRLAPAPDAVPAAADRARPGRRARTGARAPRPTSGRTRRPRRTSCTRRSATGACADGGNVLATAISVAGPATIPTPGPVAGQTAYVFTAIGTPGPAAEQKLPLNVTWVNLTTGKSGTRDPQAAGRHQPDGPDDADRDRRHRIGQHHVDDLRPGHHDREAVPVHADDRLDRRAVNATAGSWPSAQ